MPPTGLKFKGRADIEIGSTIGVTARFFDDLGLSLRSYREPLQRTIKLVFIPSIRQNFLSGGRPDPWTPLAEYTQKRREHAGYGPDKPILKRTGKLMRVATQQNIWKIGTHTAEIDQLADKVWYGQVQQDGIDATARRYGTHIPARPFLMIHEEDVDGAERVFSEWLGERIAWANARNR